MDSPNNPINLCYLNGTGYTFNIDDYMKIRTGYRILGTCVGTCNTQGWSSGTNSLPVEFNKYEIQLLLEKNYVILLNKNLSIIPNNIQIEKYKKFQENCFKEQKEFYKNKKVQTTKQHIDKIIKGKRNKSTTETGNNSKDKKTIESEILEQINDSFKFSAENSLIEVPYEHIWEHEAVITKLPIDDTLHYKVFKDLWNIGKYITSGESFGADFIIYPGDPLMFHASHLIIILNNPIVNALQLIGKCRLSVTVNKKCTFVYLNNENELCYQTVEWENFQK